MIIIEGVEDVERLLSQIAPRHAKNIMRATVHDMAKQVAEDARKDMPEDEGTMIAATKHKRDRAKGGKVSSSVRVNRIAFYWRFLEYGDGPDGVAYDFFRNAAHKLSSQMERTFLVSFAKKFEAAVERSRKRQ